MQNGFLFPNVQSEKSWTSDQTTDPQQSIDPKFYFAEYPVKNHTPYMGVSKNMGTPKWMVYNGKPY